jgi:hypothetical protein
MWWDREQWWTVFVPPVTAGVVLLLYFAITDRWTNLENPVQSQFSILAAVLGFLAGLAAQRITNWWLAGISGGIVVALGLWAYFAPHDTPEDEEFRQILVVLTGLAAVVAIALNLPQVLRGRFAPARRAEESA